MAWQLIDTAPRHREVLICDRNGKRNIATQDPKGSWVTDGGNLPDEPPTHWQELPDPPTE